MSESTRLLPDRLTIRPDVGRALEAGRPVVALESTVLTHGLPRPTNLELGLELEQIVRRAGAVPATIAVLDGRFHIGLEDDALRRVCQDASMVKLNRRDLSAAEALGWSGGTTVSATMALAHAAGIRLFATGGIGGVHRGPGGDISADLRELARTPVAVVCSGAKAILDLPRTLEWLETEGVPVVGWRTDVFPEFFTSGGAHSVSVRVDTADEAARLISAHAAFGGGLLVCVPCPSEAAVARQTVATALERAEREAAAAGVGGKERTPFLLARLAEITEGATLRANLALLRTNARVAAEIAAAMARRSGLASTPPAASA